MSDLYDAPLYSALRNLRGRCSFHMPGHKGCADIMPLDICMDATELDVTDDLYSASGPIACAQDMAAHSAGAAHTVFLTNGSTCGIQAMLGYCGAINPKVIISRAAHKSAVNACVLFGLEPIWVKALADDGGAPYTPTEFVLEAIGANPDASAVLVTRPDYYGRVCELTPIVSAAHSAGMLVLVDEAHGAHFNWADKSLLHAAYGQRNSDVQLSAMRLGADMCVQSAHKTLFALTGGAYLHMNGNVDSIEALRYVEMLQTSSPSFLTMASLDYTRAYMDEMGKQKLDTLAKMCDAFYDRILAIDGISRDFPGCAMPVDRTRLTLDVSGLGISGYDMLRGLERMGIDIEMADRSRVVMIATVADGRDDIERLAAAIETMAGILKHKGGIGARASGGYGEYPMGRFAVPPRTAALSATERVPVLCATGRIAARALSVYPPGIPVVVPGEIITDEITGIIEMAMADGASVLGLQDDMILVCK